LARTRFAGINPAVITPFSDKGELDLIGLKANIRFYMDSGVHGLVINGSTGEAAALTREERVTTIKAAAEIAKGRLKIIAGTGASTTGHAVTFSRDAEEAGADAVLVITPFSVIPNKEGLYQYYKQISQAIKIPLIAYNLPQHTGVSLGAETLVRLVDEGLVAGIKDSSGNMSVMAQIVKEVGDKISVLTGADDLLLQSFVTGCSGAIIALANIAPKQTVQLYESVQRGNISEAKDMYFKLLPVAQSIISPENFPAQVKELVKLMGRPAGPCRSPILPVSTEERKNLARALEHAELVEKIKA
jgi:4-hydroxy-tetrahydrodipicolinate synthase